MSTPPTLPHIGDYITLDSHGELGRAAVLVGWRRSGALRVRRLKRHGLLDIIRDYRGPWGQLPCNDPRHPSFAPTADGLISELGL